MTITWKYKDIFQNHKVLSFAYGCACAQIALGVKAGFGTVTSKKLSEKIHTDITSNGLLRLAPIIASSDRKVPQRGMQRQDW